MGDVAMLVPLIERLHKQYPEVKISLLTKGFFTNLFAHLAYVNCIEAKVNNEHKGILGLFQLSKELPKDIDAVADMHEVIRSKIIRSLLCIKGKKVANLNKRRAQKKALTALQPKNIQPLPSVFEAYNEVIAKLGFEVDLNIPIDSPKLSISKEILSQLGVNAISTATGFAPFAAHDPKVLPFDKSKELIKLLDAELNQEILLFGGGAKEIEALEKLAEGIPNAKVVAGKVNFPTELALIANLKLMISMDSGNGHLAAMFQKPVVSLWGATHPYAGFTPFNQPKENQFTPDLAKYPLLPTSIYGNKIIVGYEDCMHSISLEAVVKRIKELVFE